MGRLLSFLSRVALIAAARRLSHRATTGAELAAVGVALGARARRRSRARRQQALSEEPLLEERSQADAPPAAGNAEAFDAVERIAQQIIFPALALRLLRIAARALAGRNADSAIPRLSQIGFQDEQVEGDTALHGGRTPHSACMQDVRGRACHMGQQDKGVQCGPAGQPSSLRKP
jgi:hypothetical protein